MVPFSAASLSTNCDLLDALYPPDVLCPPDVLYPLHRHFLPLILPSGKGSCPQRLRYAAQQWDPQQQIHC